MQAMPAAVVPAAQAAPAAAVTAAATCVDAFSSATCSSWKSKNYCGNTWYSGTRFVGTGLCALTCGRCGALPAGGSSAEHLLWVRSNAAAAHSANTRFPPPRVPQRHKHCPMRELEGRWLLRSHLVQRHKRQDHRGILVGSLSPTRHQRGTAQCLRAPTLPAHAALHQAPPALPASRCPATCGTCAGPQANWASSTTGQYSVGGVGVYVTKTVAPFQSHVLAFLELHAGAHYYVQAPYTSTYSAARGTAYLPTTLDLKGRRIACIAFSVLSRGGATAVDFGIENAGSGWFALYYSGSSDMGFTDSGRFSTAYRVELSMRMYIDTQDRVQGVYKFYNSAGTLLGTRTLTFSRPLGTFLAQTAVNSKVPVARLIRFQVRPRRGQSGGQQLGVPAWVLSATCPVDSRMPAPSPAAAVPPA